MGKPHPIRRAILVLRIWLGMLVVMWFINANVATGYLFNDVVKSIPFYFLMMVALLWLFNTWDPRVVIVCCSALVVGPFLRGIEVLLYADHFILQQRLTGVTLWWFISGTTLAFGVLNLIAAGRRNAEEAVWAKSSQL